VYEIAPIKSNNNKPISVYNHNGISGAIEEFRNYSQPSSQQFLIKQKPMKLITISLGEKYIDTSMVPLR
jgi:hypothetical protein